jgi:hypothetical protein
MSYNRKTLFLATGNDTLKLALDATLGKAVLAYAQSVEDTQQLLPFQIEGPGETVVKGSSLKLEESGGNNTLEVRTADVKATSGNNSLTLDSTGLVLKDSVWTVGKNVRTVISDAADAIATLEDTVNNNHSSKITKISASIIEHRGYWNTYTKDGVMTLSDWTAETISTKISTADSNHTTLSDHVTDWLTVPNDTENNNAPQTLQSYVQSQVNAEKERIDLILDNAPESLNTLNELKIALETTDYNLVDVQINIVSKLNALADVVAHLTSDNPATEFPPTDVANHPTWYASIAVPVRDSVDQPEISGSTDNEQGSLVE